MRHTRFFPNGLDLESWCSEWFGGDHQLMDLLKPGLALALMLGVGAVTAQTPPPDVKPQAVDDALQKLLPLEVTVNGSKSGSWLLLEQFGSLYAPREAFDEWRVQARENAKAIMYRGTEYLPLSSIPGFSANINFSNQSIELAFSPQSFAATRLTTELSKKPVLSPVLPSFFVNYDLNYSTTTSRGSARAKELGALSEFGASNSLGVLTSSYVARNLTGDASQGTPRSWVRLETTYTKDLPETDQTLRLGDASTRTGLWGLGVYFGGVQLGSNFALTPGFISQSSPALSGISTAPSTIELYVNNVLRQVSTVPTGPFAIDNIPALRGSGDARLVVRDLLGRETVITQTFFTNSQLLAIGLSDWSAEAGRLRLDLGTASGRYGDAFASGTWRYGFNNNLTLEGRTELTRQNKVLGGGLVTGLPWQTLGKSALVASREQSLGAGYQWLLGLERQSLRTGVYFQAQGSSINFRQLGQDRSSLSTKLQLAGNLSYSTESAGSFGFGFASVSRFDAPRIFSISANYATKVGENSSLSVTANHAVAGISSTSVGATLVVPFEKNKFMTGSVTQRSGQQDYYLTAAQSPGFDQSLGWRTLTGQQQGIARAEAGLYYMGRYGRLSGDLSASPSQSATRVGATGGLVLADGYLFATQRVNESFAVAEVQGYGDVGIGLGSNVLTRTNPAGIALIPRMVAYQNNAIRIDPAELPLSAEIDSIEQVVVPAWRSAVKVVFPVRTGRAALLKIIFDDGEPAPAGAVVQIDDDKQEFYVARRGEAFVTGLPQTISQLRLTWNDKQCQFSVILPPPSPDEIVRLGPLQCKGVAR